MTDTHNYLPSPDPSEQLRSGAACAVCGARRGDAAHRPEPAPAKPFPSWLKLRFNEKGEALG